MPTTLSVDLRQRVVTAVAAGATCRQAAERFGVSRASASRWSQQKQREGHVAPKPLGGDQRSQRIEAHAALILQTYEARPQIFLRELSSCASCATPFRSTGSRSAPAACRASWPGTGSRGKRGAPRR